MPAGGRIPRQTDLNCCRLVGFAGGIQMLHTHVAASRTRGTAGELDRHDNYPAISTQRMARVMDNTLFEYKLFKKAKGGGSIAHVAVLDR